MIASSSGWIDGRNTCGPNDSHRNWSLSETTKTAFEIHANQFVSPTPFLIHHRSWRRGEDKLDDREVAPSVFAYCRLIFAHTVPVWDLPKSWLFHFAVQCKECSETKPTLIGAMPCHLDHREVSAMRAVSSCAERTIGITEKVKTCEVSG